MPVSNKSKPGVDLDKEIADAMGWTKLEIRSLVHTAKSQLVGIRPGALPSSYTGYVEVSAVPEFSTNVIEAMSVVDFIVSKGYRWPFSGMFNDGCEYKALARDICLRALESIKDSRLNK